MFLIAYSVQLLIGGMARCTVHCIWLCTAQGYVRVRSACSPVLLFSQEYQAHILYTIMSRKVDSEWIIDCMESMLCKLILI